MQYYRAIKCISQILRKYMKSPAMLLTPKFGVDSSRKIVGEAQKKITPARKTRLEKLAAMASKAYGN
jgi:hypothetical protein